MLAFEMAIKHAATDAFILFGVIVQPLMIATLALYVLGESRDELAIFIVVGSGLTGLWDSVLFTSGSSITQERWSGTLEPLVGMPTPMPWIVFGKNLAYVIQALLSMLLSYTLASIFFGSPIRIATPGLFIASILFTILSFVCLGLVLATLFVINPDVQRWQNGLEFPVFILSGFLFPIALLPGWTTPLSYLLAPYWAAQALHTSSSAPAVLADVIGPWVMMLLLSGVYLLVALWLFRVMLRKARVDASLSRQ
jgi:ABC-2 type transport system permease protein